METPVTMQPPAEPADSLWADITPGTDATQSLQGDVSMDFGIVGAGFMGLTAALSLAALGAKVAVVEAATVGWGASGRNNGLLAPGLKRDPWEVRRALGIERGNALLRFSREATQRVRDLVDQHDIDCDLSTAGWIQAAHARSGLRRIERRVEEWQALGADIQMIAADRVQETLGTPYFVGASRDLGGGSLNPLAYVRGLAAAAVSAGAQLFEQSPVVRSGREGGRWQLESLQGRLNCDRLLICTNAYNREMDTVCGTVIPVRTAQVASAPLTNSQAAQILPGGEGASDTHRLLTSFRVTPDRRLIMGGASATAGDEHDGLFTHLHRRAAKQFPFLGEIEWQYGWSGYLGITRDHLPKIFEVAPGCWAGVSCNGRGIALATATGEVLADLVIGGDRARCSVPIETPSRQWQYEWREPGVATSVIASRWFDHADRWLGGLRASR